jgi:DNA helicase II / ATP-dependent DNA helicase PcrA
VADRAVTLTAEQKAAVRCNEDLMLTACPGSGKTRVIISKLSRAIDDVRDTPRAVACITYTNAAVQEIEARLRHHIQPGDDSYYDICTIHSFCLNHIFRPFCYLINGYKNGAMARSW